MGRLYLLFAILNDFLFLFFFCLWISVFDSVTVIELASTGLAMLSEKGEQFEVVIVNITSPDFQGFRLLEAAVDKGKAAFCEHKHSLNPYLYFIEKNS